MRFDRLYEEYGDREQMSGEIIVFVTAPNEDEASRIAGALVEERLAACVNILPGVQSIYRWQGEVTRDSELLLIIKSTAQRYGEIERRVHELHSYSTPEVVAIGIGRGSEKYLQWLRDAV